MHNHKNHRFWSILSFLEAMFSILAVFLQIVINVMGLLIFILMCLEGEVGLWLCSFFIVFSPCLLVHNILFARLPFYAQKVNIWAERAPEQVKIDQKIMLRRYLIATAFQTIPILLMILTFLLGLEEGLEAAFGFTAGIVVFFWGEFLLTLYCLQFFRPTLRKRIIFDCVFFPAVIGWYDFLFRAVF